RRIDDVRQVHHRRGSPLGELRLRGCRASCEQGQQQPQRSDQARHRGRGHPSVGHGGGVASGRGVVVGGRGGGGAVRPHVQRRGHFGTFGRRFVRRQRLRTV